MRVNADIAELTVMHPRLLWDDIGAALVAVLKERHLGRGPIHIELMTVGLPSYDSEQLSIAIELGHVEAGRVSALRRTDEAPRLVELAAIAVAALGLYYAGGHEIRDVALRGSAADYLVKAIHVDNPVTGERYARDGQVTRSAARYAGGNGG